MNEKESLEAIAKIPPEMSEHFLRKNYAQLAFSEDELRIKKAGMMASVFPDAWMNPGAWNGVPDIMCRWMS